ncbi:hypothetical protein AB0K51_05075 [Kitasatospora sp. NPDC049285]
MRLFQRLFGGSERSRAVFGVTRKTRGKSDVAIKHDVRPLSK